MQRNSDGVIPRPNGARQPGARAVQQFSASPTLSWALASWARVRRVARECGPRRPRPVHDLLRIVLHEKVLVRAARQRVGWMSLGSTLRWTVQWLRDPAKLVLDARVCFELSRKNSRSTPQVVLALLCIIGRAADGSTAFTRGSHPLR